MQQLIFLIGFMGSGKSFTGRRLAQRLALPFIDLDELIEQEAGRSIPRIFQEDGEAAFRKLEAETLRSLENRTPAVIACGGGTPCFHDNMEWMNTHGLTVFLDPPVAVIADRLQREMDHRPLLQGLTAGALQSFIEARLQERRPFYQQATVIYRDGASGGDPATELARHLLDSTGHGAPI